MFLEKMVKSRKCEEMITFLVPGENTHDRNDFQGILRSINREIAKMLCFGDFRFFHGNREICDFPDFGAEEGLKSLWNRLPLCIFPARGRKGWHFPHISGIPQTFPEKVRNVRKSTKGGGF